MRRRAVLVLLVLAGLAWAVGAPTWVSGVVAAPEGGTRLLAVAGSAAAPALPAAALVLGAAGLGAALAGRAARVLVAVVVAVAGVLTVAASAQVLADPAAPLRRLAATSTGVAAVQQASATGWPWAAVALGAVVVAAGGWLLRVRWPAPRPRYERAPDDWDRLTEGEDPTGPAGPGVR